MGKLVRFTRAAAFAVALCAMAVAVAACGSSGSSTGSSTSGGGSTQSTSGGGGSTKPVKTGLMLYAPKNSEGWTQAGYQAAARLQKEGLITLTTVENVAQNSQAATQSATQLIQDGTQLVLAHSGTWGQAVQDMSSRYKSTDFAWTGADVKGGNRENVAAVTFPIYQVAYLAGILAAGVSKSGVVSIVSGFDIPVCHAETVAFEKGAQKARPDIKVIPSYIGSWTDPDKAKEATLAAADRGADVFVPCGVEPGTISGAVARHATVMGDTVNESHLAPKNLVASLVWNPYIQFKRIVDDIRAGTFTPAKTYGGGIKDGVVSLELNPQYSVNKVPAKTLKEIKKVQAQIKSGQFTVPYVTK